MLRSVFSLAIQLLPGVLLILFGWGFDDLPAFFANPARAALAALVVIAALAAVLLRLDLHPLRRGSSGVGTQAAQLAVLLMLSLALLWFLPFADRRRLLTLRHESWRYVGLLLCGIGVAVTRLLAAKNARPTFQRIRNPAAQSSAGAKRHLCPNPPSPVSKPAAASNGNRAGICEPACMANPRARSNICFRSDAKRRALAGRPFRRGV